MVFIYESNSYVPYKPTKDLLYRVQHNSVIIITASITLYPMQESCIWKSLIRLRLIKLIFSSLFGYVGRILRKNIITTIIRYIWTFLSAVSTLYIQLKTDFVKNLYYHIHSGKNSQDKNPKQRDSTILSMVYLSYSVHCTLYKIEVFLDRWLNHDRLFSCTHHKTHLCSRYWFDHHVKFQPELRWAWYSYCPNHLATLPESMYPEPSIITISKVMALNSSFWSTARTNEGSLSRILCLMHHLTRWRLLCGLVSTSTLWCSFLCWKIWQPFVPLKNNRRYIC